MAGAIAGAVLYTAYNHQTFNVGEYRAVVAAGAIAGGLIGSGVGLAASSVIASEVATASSLIGAGTSAAITESSYISNNSEEFATTPFIAQSGASAVAGALTSNPEASLTTKALANIGSAETAYFSTGESHSLTGTMITAGAATFATGLQFGFDVTAEEYLMINRPLGSDFSKIPSATGWSSAQNTRTIFYGTFSGSVTGLAISGGQSIANNVDQCEKNKCMR